jgi:hypothetical protein
MHPRRLAPATFVVFRVPVEWYVPRAGLAASLNSGDGKAARRSSIMVHDLVLAVVFLSLIVAPALIAMRVHNGEQGF